MKTEKKLYIIIAFILSLIVISSCSNYHKDMIEWYNNVPVGTELIIVKENQPDYIKINWESPVIFENGIIRYSIIKIKGDNDLLKMSYFLEFKDNKFIGQFAHK